MHISEKSAQQQPGFRSEMMSGHRDQNQIQTTETVSKSELFALYLYRTFLKAINCAGRTITTVNFACCTLSSIADFILSC